MAENDAAPRIVKLESSLPFEIHSMQWINRNRGQRIATPHSHEQFVVIWVKSGSGTHYIDLEKHELKGGSVYCLSPGQIHLLKSSEDIDGIVISFSADFLCLSGEHYDLLFNSGLFYASPQTPVIPVSPEMHLELEDITQLMQKEFDNFFLLRSEILGSFLRIFLLYLAKHVEEAGRPVSRSRNMELIRRFLALVEQHFTSRRMVSDYAYELAVTPNYLNEVVKKTTGSSASDHIKQRVVLEAKRQAAYTDVSMKEIAFGLGFEDVAHFSKYFKNATGINFSDFKKNASLLFS